MSKDVHALIRSILGSPIAFHKVYLHITKSASAAVMLSQMVYWQGRTAVGNDDWFYKTQEEWFEETALSDESQVTARRQLCKLEVLEEKRKGPRRQLWFKINMKKLVDLVQEQNKFQVERNEKRVSENLGDSSESRVREPRGQASGNLGVESPGTSGSLLTENTTKTTSEIIPAAPQPEAKVHTKHFEFQQAYQQYWDSANDITMPWDGSEARALTVFMKTNSGLSVAGFTRLLVHRATSDVNHSERPRSVIPRLTDYARGPLDTYNKPKLINGGGRKIAEKEQDIHDTVNSSAIAKERILGKGKEVRPAGSVSGQVRSLLESSTDNPGTDRGLVRRD